MSANNEQIGGTHYRDMDIQPWDAMRAWMSPEQFCGYLLGTAIAYLARVNVAAPGKGGIDDIEKARHVLTKLAETWNFRIFNEFPKEVMQTEPVHSDPRSSVRNDTPVAAPAVSESAAGDANSPTIEQIAELRRELAARCAAPMLAPTRCGGTFDPVEAWPGPDWSQAPEEAMWWTADGEGFCLWHTQKPGIMGFTHHWDCPGGGWPAPFFNYPGHWRDSLRRRP